MTQNFAIGRPREESSDGEAALRFGVFIEQGLAQYGFFRRQREIWDVKVVKRLIAEGKMDASSAGVADGHNWVRLTLSKLRNGKRVSYRVQRDLFLLICYSDRGLKWRKDNGSANDLWLADALRHAALSKHQPVRGVLDPDSMRQLAEIVAAELAAGNSRLGRRAAVVSTIESVLRSLGPEMAWNATTEWTSKYGPAIAESVSGDRDTVALDVLGALSEQFFPDQPEATGGSTWRFVSVD